MEFFGGVAEYGKEKRIKLHEELKFVFQYNLHWMVGSVLRNLQAASELANEKAKMNEWGADTFTSSALLE